MNDNYQTAAAVLLAPTGISDKDLQTVFSKILGKSIDAADIYVQAAQFESWLIEDSIIKEGNFHIDRGVGVRVISGEKTGFAYSDDILLPALEEAASAARGIVHQHDQGKIKAWRRTEGHVLYPVHNPLGSMNETDKINLLQRLDKATRQMDPRVTQVIISLAGLHETVLVYNSDGTLGADIRPLVRLSVQVVVEENGRREQASAGGGGRADYAYFLEEDRALSYCREAVRQAILNLHAVPAPAGMMPVVLCPGWPGILLHEAIGHGLEGDFNRKGTSAFSGRIGERVASPTCTIVDDGTLKGRRGSLNMDDEATPTQCTMLIEKGVLRGYMQDKLNARLMKMAPTGNGRRESYANLPMPRMTNTYMLPGKYAPEEIIATVEKGIYAVNFGSGQVDITSGKFVFSANEAYLIEKGKITRPVKGATFIGNGPDVLLRVSMVGHDLKLDEGVGTCGKEGQSVPVGVGQPTVKIDELTVGGSEVR